MFFALKTQRKTYKEKERKKKNKIGAILFFFPSLSN